MKLLADQDAQYTARILHLPAPVEGHEPARLADIPTPSDDLHLRVVLPLTTALVPQVGVAPMTIVAPAGATMLDNLGRLNLMSANQFRARGARLEKNLISYSQDCTNAAWTKSGVSVLGNVARAPDGTYTACKLVEDSATNYHLIQISGISGVAGWYIYSVYARAAERTWMQLQWRGGDGTYYYALFDLVNGVTGIVATGVTAAITSVGDDGWYRCSIKANAAAGATYSGELICVRASNSTSSYAGDGSSGIFVWGALSQFNDTLSVYFPRNVLTAPYHGCNVDNTKLFSIDSAGSAISGSTLLGYINEERVKNLARCSSNFNNSSYWSGINSPSLTIANVLCGDVSLDLLNDNSASELRGYSQTISFSEDGYKSVSFLVKKGTSTSAVVRLRDTTASADRLLATITWSGTVPVITYTTGSQERASWALYGDVYRIFCKTASVTATNSNQIEFYPATDSALSAANTGDINIGGVQCEDKAFAGTLVPTDTAAVELAGFLLSSQNNLALVPSRGTIYLECTPIYSFTDAGYLWATAIDAENKLALLVESNALIMRKRINGTNYDATIALTPAGGTTYKIAGRWGPAGVDVFLDGTKGTNHSNTTAAQIGTTFQVGSNGVSGQHAPVYLRNLKMWIDALVDSTLTTMTT